jgi:hypothetical protein
MIFKSEIDLCFWNPAREKPPGKERGVLYLLRRDLTELYGAEEEIPSATLRAPMLACIGIMTGLDLMSKLATNELSKGRVGFKRFVKTYGGLPPMDAEVVYRLRCAQTHAYCLIDIDERANTEYCFVLDPDHPDESMIQAQPSKEADGCRQETFRINFWELKRFFCACVGRFERAIRDPGESSTGPRLTSFMLAMARFGKVEVYLG